MTRQEIFSKVFQGLTSQGYRQSRNHAGRCALHGKEGRKCAIGWLIPDEKYDREMEDFVSPLSALKRIDMLDNLEVGGKEICRRLMKIHDNNDVPERMNFHLNELARELDLVPA